MTNEQFDRVMNICMWVGIAAILTYYTMVFLKLVAYDRLQSSEPASQASQTAQRVPVENPPTEATETATAETSVAQGQEDQATHEVYSGVGD